MKTNARASIHSSRVCLTATIIALLVASYPVKAQTPDSFNPGASSYVYALAVQPDGKILAAGWFGTLGGQPRERIGRLNDDGSVDAGFNPGAGPDWVDCLVVQPDGKLLVGGGFTTLAGQTQAYLGRLNADGTLDATFDPKPSSYVNCLVVQPNGQILLGGQFSELSGQTRNSMGRVNADGSLDTAFNPGANGQVNSLALQADGKILVGGSFSVLVGQTRRRIGRLNADGSLDTSFNPTADGSFSPVVHCLAVQPDGKILVGGSYSTLGGQARSSIGRLNADGSLDASFNPGANDSVYSLALQTDGKILVAGRFTTLGGATRNYFGRLNANGSLDTTFNLGVGGDSSYSTAAYSLAMQPDGKILLSGNFTTLGGQTRNNIGRINNTTTATEDLTFDGAALNWLRAGAGPEIWHAGFDASTNGLDFFDLGAGARILGGWQLTGLTVPTNATIRARGLVAGGYRNGSGWSVESSIGQVIITSQPGSRTNNAAAVALFQAQAVGTPPLNYQWRKGGVNLSNGGNISGAGTATLSLSNVLDADEGSYSVVISNSLGSVTSMVATLTVVDPVISSQPNGQVANWSDTVAFNVTAAGTALKYQWRKGGVTMAGATSSSLLLTNVNLTNAGGYDVVVSNTLGSVTSVVATLTVVDPAIIEWPFSQKVSPGQTASFSVDAVGTPQLSYQWRKDGAILAGAQDSLLTLTNVQGADAGYYDVIVSNVSGSVTSAVAGLTVNLVTADAFNPEVDGYVSTTVVQTDGKILVGGSFFELGGQPLGNIQRLNADGSLDADFDPGASGMVVNSLAVQADGKILVGGDLFELHGEERRGLGRLNADGSLDTTFNPGVRYRVHCLALQADGRVLVGGDFFELGGQSRENIGRLHADGTLDATFNPVADGWVNCLAVQPDGKILLGGNFMMLGGQERRHIARLLADGTLDAAFDPGADGQVNLMVMQTDGKILVGGEFWELAGQERRNLGRLNPDGSLDADFGPALDTESGGWVNCLEVQTDGKILVGGYFSTLGGQPRKNLGRLIADGSLDLTFDWGIEGMGVNSVTVQTDGKILVGGDFLTQPGEPTEDLRRLNNTRSATQNLTFAGSTITWLRGGASPEVWRTTLEYSTNGTNWASLGAGSHIANGWQRASVSVPTNSAIRARGFTANGGFSSSFVETTISPPVITTQPVSQAVSLGGNAEFNVTAAGLAPLTTQWYRDGEVIPGATNSILRLSSVPQGADGSLYSVMVINALGAVISSNATLTVVPPLAVALDALALTWGSGGHAPWIGQASTTHDGTDAAQSGVLTHGQQSWVETVVIGPGSLGFWWKVSSESDYDFLEFRTNGVLAARISGEIPWQQRSVQLANGLQVLRWRYTKDGSGDAGKDRGWLDEAVFISSRPRILVNENSFGFSSNRFGFSINGADGQIVVVEGSTNLLIWTALTTNTLGSGLSHFSDPRWTNFPQRFYRAVVLP